jgi:spermidine synthase/MFS family permease
MDPQPGRTDDSADRATDGPLPGWLAISLVVGTSAAVLILEILAARLLAPYVGVSLDTYTGIIGTVLAGIAVGAWLGGWAADRIDPRRLLPALLLAGGALAIATVPIVRAIGPAMRQSGGPGIVVLAAVGFLPSATVLSAVSPAVVKLQLRDLSATGTTVGRLSAFGTIGAIVATFLTGFVLVAVAPVTTLIVTVGVLVVVAGLAVWAWWYRSQHAVAADATALSAFAGVALVAAVAVGSPCDTQTEYYCVSIRDDDERPDGRVLVLDDLRHSYVDVDDPTYLGFWYTRRLADAVDAQTDGPIDVVHLGGGALTLPAWVQATRPGSDQTVLEIDERLADLVADEFDRTIGPGTGIELALGDARLTLPELAEDSADVVIGDAFASRSVPWHLATQEYVDEIERVLRPGGVYAANVIDGPDRGFLRAYAATIATRFDHVAIVLGEVAAAGGGGNSVIVASDAPIDEAALRAAIADDADPGELVDDPTGFLDGAQVLTDDFAPVDQLIAGTA